MQSKMHSLQKDFEKYVQIQYIFSEFAVSFA